jgi:glycerol-1-phosphate dehydrogenase [NAD(P)+]
MEVSYGAGLLARESAGFRDPIVLTTPTPWSLARASFASPPRAVIEVRSLEREVLDEIVRRAPKGGLVVGIGGGMVADAAKYAALHWKKPLVLVPTITSGNGPFTRSIAVREGGTPVGMQGGVRAERVLVDYEIVQSASPTLNRAGIGDVLHLHTCVFDWRLAARHRADVPWDDEAAGMMRRTVDEACAAAPEIGAVTAKGIQTLMNAFRTSATIHERIQHPQAGAGSEHLFAWALEAVTGRHFIHGQIVSLGIVIMATLQRNDPRLISQTIAAARVPFRPRELDLTWEDVERTLASIPAYNRKTRHFYTICDQTACDAETLNEVRAAIS